MFPYGDSSTQVYIAQWLSDTPVHLDALEIIAEKARRFWWGQQVELAMISWSLLLSIEGRRRNIPHLWAYLALAHMVNLSFAQNLFYLALLLTPTPIPSAEDSGRPASFLTRLRRRFVDDKPANWTPHPGLLGFVLTQSFGILFAAPIAAGTDSFAKLLVVARVLTFVPLVLPVIVPVSWGTIHAHPHGSYEAFVDQFRYVSMATFLLQTKVLATGLRSNAPDAYYHRHSKFLPFDWEKRSALERTSTAFSRMLGSTSDHPVVAGVAWDVLLSGVSVMIWAAIRSLDINDILASATPFFKTRTLEGLQYQLTREISTDGSDTSEVGRPVESAKGRALRSSSKVEDDEADGTSARGAISRGSRRSTRQRGRETTDETGNDDGTADKTYKPTAAESGAAVESDVIPQDEADFEAAALTWGLNVLGGLGFGSAGVFGAECISR